MAEVSSPSDKRLENLEKEITCTLCHGHYREARLLPCMHCYCRTCIEELAERSRGQPFPCPECQKDTTLPSGGAEQLQSVFYVDRMKDLYEKMAKAEGKMEAMCEQCSTGEAVAFCRHCTGFICAECVRQHQKLKVFSGHRVMTLEDLRCGGPLDIPLKEAPPPTCPQHDEPMKFFCFACDHLICSNCLLQACRWHKCDIVKKCAKESKRSLQDSLTPFSSIQTNIRGAEEELSATEVQIDAKKEEVCRAIKQSFDQLEAVVEQQKKKTLSDVTTLVQEKKDVLTAQRKSLQMAVTNIQRLVEFVQQVMKNASDQDVMVICTQLHAKMEEEEKRHQQLSLEPATTANIAYDPPSVDAIPKDLGKVYQPLLEERDASHFQLGKLFNMTLKVPDFQDPVIQAELKSVVYRVSSVQADINQKGAGVYSITCTPFFRGRHELTVKVNGKDMVGSPFGVFVGIHPTQLGPPIRTITGVKEPCGIALNNKQHVIVTEYGQKKVSIRERDGKGVQIIKCDMFQSPCGVATDQDEAIYVTDKDAHSLFKFNKEGRLLRSVQSDLKCPYFIKNIKNRLYVADHGSNVVRIFDIKCNVIGCILTNECLKPFDIAKGDDGLYVAGQDKISVYACAPNGKFLHHLNIKPSSIKLFGPKCICFDYSGHLLVTQTRHELCGVYVLKSSGECVATFSLNCSEKLERPAGIAIDDDGFVYVCDHPFVNVF